MSTAIHEPPQAIRVGRLVPASRQLRQMDWRPRAEPPAPKSGEVRLLLFLGLGGAACLAGLALAGFLLLPSGNGVQGEAATAPPALIATILPASEKSEPLVLPAPIPEPPEPELLPKPVLEAAIPEPEPAPQPVLLATVPSADIAATPTANLLPVKPAPAIVQEPKNRSGCEKFGTRIAFLLNPPDAFKKAQEEHKQVFFLHLSGNFEDKEFTWNNAEAFRVNALANDKVADYINENFVATFLKVGTFQIINGQKVGGNVASYFCLPDGAVVHAIPGQVGADTLLSEARWACETRKYALTRSTYLNTGAVEMSKFRFLIHKAHEERFALIRNPEQNRQNRPIVVGRLPKYLPKNLSLQAQAHWFLTLNPLAHIDRVFPYVWEEILNERLSGLPVAIR